MDALKALYTTTDGRISRKQWWLGLVGLIIASIVLSIILSLVGLGVGSRWGQLIGSVILFYPGWCIAIKRRQDRDSNAMDYKILAISLLVLGLAQALGIGFTVTDIGNGMEAAVPDMWMSVLYMLLGIFGLYMLVQLGFLKGTPGTNTYGADPLGYAVAA